MNMDKTNFKQTPIEINNHPLEYLQQYLYLRQIISYEEQTTKEINKRKTSRWKKYWSWKEIMKSNELSMSTKKKLPTPAYFQSLFTDVKYGLLQDYTV